MVEPGVHHHQTGEALGHLGGLGQADRTAPVLAEEGNVLQIQVLDQGSVGGGMPGDGVPVILQRLVGTAKTKMVGGNATPARGGQSSDDAAIEEAPRGHPVHQQRRRSVARPDIKIVHPQPVDIEERRRMGKVGKVGEV